MTGIRRVPSTYQEQIQAVEETRRLIHSFTETQNHRQKWIESLYPSKADNKPPIDYRALVLPYLSQTLTNLVQHQLP